MKERDYTNYSIAELREAINTVDGHRFPENKAALEAELQKRIDSGEVEREEKRLEREAHSQEQDLRHFARGARQWIGLYLIGAPLILLNMSVQMPNSVGWMAFALFGLAVLYVGVSALAGYGLWKRKDWGHRPAIVVLALQLISFQSGFLHYSLTSAISGYVYVAAPGELGVSGYISTGSFIFVAGDLPLTFSVGVNLVALVMIWLLYKGRQPLDGEEAGIETCLAGPAE